MTKPTAREIRRTKKADACADRLVAQFPIMRDTVDVREAIRAAYIAGWSESIDDAKRMIEEAEGNR